MASLRVFKHRLMPFMLLCMMASSAFAGINPTAPAIYEIKLSSDTRYCLDNKLGNLADANPIHLWGCNGRDTSQAWQFLPNGEIRLAGTNFCLDNLYGQVISGNTVALWGCGSGDGSGQVGAHQKWEWTNAGEIRYANTNFCLDLLGHSINPGTRIALWQCHGGENQRFDLSPIFTGCSSAQVPGFKFVPFLDSWGNDIFPQPASGGIQDYGRVCLGLPQCKGFNSNGWIKDFVKPQSDWHQWTDDSCLGFYVRT